MCKTACDWGGEGGDPRMRRTPGAFGLVIFRRPVIEPLRGRGKSSIGRERRQVQMISSLGK